MTIKVQCECGTRYSFDAEPQNGVMPFPVNCPSCQADGTEAANQIIREQSTPRLRMQTPVAPAPAGASLPPPSIPIAQPPRGAAMQKFQAEARQTRRVLWLGAGILLLVLLLAGGWAWYTFAGSKPRLLSSAKLPAIASSWHMEYLDGGKILLASVDRVILRDLAQRDLWVTTLPNSDPASGTAEVLVDKQSIWVCTGNQVVRLDRQSGAVKLTIPIEGRLASFTPAAASILVVSETSETRRLALRIDLASGETSRREIEVPRAQQHAMPDELPPNVAPTAGVLLAQATEEHKFNKPLDAISSEFFSAGENLVELRVRLLEPKVEWVKSIRPRGPSLINGNTTASTSATAVESEVFNDIKRDRTGGVKAVDESRYEVRLRRWNAERPVEWKGEVTGVPGFFSLATVDLLTAGKSLTVFDKQNNRLFAAQLSYPVSERFGEGNAGNLVPALERSNMLYFFDQGVLTAFSLPGGEVQWRMPSVGISRVQFDGGGRLYIDSTAASPEDIQYSEEIKLEATPAVILQADPRTGKILWQAQNLGQHCFLSGKYVYTMSGEQGGVGLAVGLAEAVNAPRPGAPTYFHIYRLDPDTGKVMWKFFREEAPDEADFQQNSFALRFGSEVQTWGYLDF